MEKEWLEETGTLTMTAGTSRANPIGEETTCTR